MRPAVILVLVGMLALAHGWVHPGILVSKEQLAFIKSQVNAKADPIYTAFEKATKSSSGSLSYKPKGPPSNGSIICGSYSNPDIGCNDDDDDSTAAFTQSLLWTITGVETYATNAITLLNKYGSTLKKFLDSNAPLQAGWSSTKWLRAAEIIRHTSTSWSASEITTFSNTVTSVHLPLIENGSGANGNWELTMIEGMLNIAIFTENEALFNKSILFWNQRVPAYFYYEPLDGSTHKASPRGTPSWYGQTVFNGETSGVGQETCRDFAHLQFGLSSSLDCAETARIQGVDLYGSQQGRLIAAMEFHAKYLAGAPIPSFLCGGNGVTLAQKPTFDIGYNHYHNRLGQSLPNTLNHLNKDVRPMTDLTDTHIEVFETLTHGGNPSSVRV